MRRSRVHLVAEEPYQEPPCLDDGVRWATQGTQTSPPGAARCLGAGEEAAPPLGSLPKASAGPVSGQPKAMSLIPELKKQLQPHLASYCWSWAVEAKQGIMLASGQPRLGQIC